MLSSMRFRDLLSVVIILAQYGGSTFAIPPPLALTTSQAIATGAAETVFNGFSEPIPKASATPWLEQVPISAHRLAKKAESTTTSKAMPMITGNSFGQVVIASTKQSTLPPAICGFLPYSDVHSSLEMFGCSSGSLLGGSRLTYNTYDRCSSSNNRFFCVSVYTPYNSNSPTSTITGTVELSSGTMLSYYLTSSYTTSYSTYSTSTYAVTVEPYTWRYTSSTDYASTYTTTRLYSDYSYTYSTSSITYMTCPDYIWRTSYITETITTMSSTRVITTRSTRTTYLTVPRSASTGLPYTFNPYSACWTKLSNNCELTSYYSVAAPSCTASIANTNTIDLLPLAALQTKLVNMTMTFSTTTAIYYTSNTVFVFIEMYTSRPLQATGTSTIDPSPSGYFNLIKSDPPACVNTTCAPLLAASQRCWSEAYPPGPGDCMCNALAVTNCTEICQSSLIDRRSYFNWAMDLCHSFPVPLSNNETEKFATAWPEAQNRSIAISADALPFDWAIQPSPDNETSRHCSSKALNLGSLAVNNGIVGIAAVILGRRTTAKWLTRGHYGVAGSKWWPLVSILVVGLNVLANFINAILVDRKAGYTSPDIGTLMLFWFTRPRLAWVATTLIPLDTKGSMYISVAISTLLSEILLQCLPTYIMFQTVIFASNGGYFSPKVLKYVPGSWTASLMYASALLWIISIGFFFIYMTWKFLIGNKVFGVLGSALWGGFKSSYKPFWISARYVGEKISDIGRLCFQYRRARPDEYPMDTIGGELAAEPYKVKEYKGYLKQMCLKKDVVPTVARVYWFMALPYLCQWLFWIGFAELYGDRYCLPVLWEMIVVWTMFELLGIFLSAVR